MADAPVVKIANSGQTWIDFHLTLVGRNGGIGAEYPGMRMYNYVGPGTETFVDDNLEGLGYNEVLHIDDLSIPDGNVLSFSVDIYGGTFPEGLTEFDIVGEPSIPEPATLALLAVGGGAALLRRRRR